MAVGISVSRIISGVHYGRFVTFASSARLDETVNDRICFDLGVVFVGRSLERSDSQISYIIVVGSPAHESQPRQRDSADKRSAGTRNLRNQVQLGSRPSIMKSKRNVDKNVGKQKPIS